MASCLQATPISEVRLQTTDSQCVKTEPLGIRLHAFAWIQHSANNMYNMYRVLSRIEFGGGGSYSAFLVRSGGMPSKANLGVSRLQSER